MTRTPQPDGSAEVGRFEGVAAVRVAGPDKITDDGREQLRALGFNV